MAQTAFVLSPGLVRFRVMMANFANRTANFANWMANFANWMANFANYLGSASTIFTSALCGYYVSGTRKIEFPSLPEVSPTPCCDCLLTLCQVQVATWCFFVGPGSETLDFPCFRPQQPVKIKGGEMS